MNLDRVVFIREKLLKKGQKVRGDGAGVQRVADYGHGLRGAPSDHWGVIVDQFGELLPHNFFFLVGKSLIDLCIELAGCDPHGIVVTLVKSSNKINILLIDAVHVEHCCDFL